MGRNVRLHTIAIVVAIAWAFTTTGIAIAAGPILSAEQVAALASAAFGARGATPIPGQRFEAQRPKFSAHDGLWYVPFLQKGAVLGIDGDMVVVVNDHTRKTCIGQMMSPPPPCT
jgi:hypothetical protein